MNEKGAKRHVIAICKEGFFRISGYWKVTARFGQPRFRSYCKEILKFHEILV